MTNDSYATNTKITICGCAAVAAPPVLFPPPGTSLACLSSGTASPLAKRAQVFVTNIQGLSFVCNTTDAPAPIGNPFQGCLNTMQALCSPTYVSGNSARISYCKTSTNTMFMGMNIYWQAVLNSCAPWKAGYSSAPSSVACNQANENLMKNAFYLSPDKTPISIKADLIKSVNQRLWGNPALA